jgi:large subunit ribosomal protein L5
MAKERARLRAVYDGEVVPELMKKFGTTNRLAVPRLEKIVVNIGAGDALQNIKLLDAASAELAAICGQRPIITRARKSIAAFKVREGNPIGTAVTLRGDRMYEFLDRLINIALPRVRDFRGVPGRSFDGRGNYTLGLQDQLVFLEVNYSKVERVRGMNITIVTTARTDEEGRELLRLLGMPFRRAAA